MSATRTIERTGPKLTGRAAALLVAVTVLALVAIVPVRALFDQRGRIAELERRATELEAENTRLRSEIARLHDPAELERRARECLGMVRPGEIALIIPGSGPQRSDC